MFKCQENLKRRLKKEEVESNKALKMAANAMRQMGGMQDETPSWKSLVEGTSQKLVASQIEVNETTAI
jgi:hypothetical protein